MATFNDEQRTKMISELMSDKENLLAGVSSVLTPGRRPLKPVQENIAGTPEAFTTLKNRIARSSLTPNGLNQRKKRKSKRFSIPVHVFRKTLSQNTRIKSPLTLPLGISKVEEEIVERSFASKAEVAARKKNKSIDEVVCDVVEKVEKRPTNHVEKEEKELDSLAENVVKQVFQDIAKSSKVNQEKESNEKKIKEFTQIILQMNKERLELEKQLSFYKKETVESKTTQSSSIRVKVPNANKNRCKESKSHLDLEKMLSYKTKEIQQLKRELQQTKLGGKKSKVHSEKELEAKKEELKQLKIELNQLQHQVREVPGLKNELQKSRQQVTQLNDVAFSCRRENNNQKTLLAKLQKELTSKEARTKQHLEECEKHTKALQKDLSEKDKTIQELRNLSQNSKEELELYKIQSETLCSIVGRLEAVVTKAQKFKLAAEHKVKDLSSSIKGKENLCISLEEQLQSSRNDSMTYKEECEQLKARIKDLEHEVDIGHLEISRQQGVISSLEEQLEKMRIESCTYQDQLELIQVQQQEMNEFLEEEKRTLEETAREMERELEETRFKGMKMDERFRETSVRCGELEQEIKLSRSLYLEKQEELDATQSQAHCIMFQLQNEITDAQESIADVWGILDGLLNRFREQARLEYSPAQKHNNDEEKLKECCTKASPSRSLVQSILAAVAKGTKPENSDDDLHIEDQPTLTLCTQINELKQGLVELAHIGNGQAASDEAMQKIAELENDRESLGLSYKRLVQNLQSELDNCRTTESGMQVDIQRQKNEINYLRSTLDTMREQLQQNMKKNESMCHLLDVEAKQRQQIKLLNEELSRKEDEYKRLESEKECIAEQLNEMIGKVNELCDNPATKTSLPGKVLEEKFVMERKLKQIKEKYLEYRLKTEDTLNEHKITANQEIKNLERNLNKAETEICRLDEILEKIRIVLHKNQEVIDGCLPLAKVLKFLDGDETCHH